MQVRRWETPIARSRKLVAGSAYAVTARGAMRASDAFGFAEFVQKSFRRDQIRGVETLREAVVDRLKAGDGVGGATLMPPQASEACRRAQLP